MSRVLQESLLTTISCSSYLLCLELSTVIGLSQWEGNTVGRETLSVSSHVRYFPSYSLTDEFHYGRGKAPWLDNQGPWTLFQCPLPLGSWHHCDSPDLGCDCFFLELCMTCFLIIGGFTQCNFSSETFSSSISFISVSFIASSVLCLQYLLERLYKPFIFFLFSWGFIPHYIYSMLSSSLLSFLTSVVLFLNVPVTFQVL